MNRDSSVGIETRYWLDGPGNEYRCGRDFPHPSRPALGSTQPPLHWVPGLFPGIKRPGRGVNHPPQSSAEVKEREELHHYSPSGPSWPVLGRSSIISPNCMSVGFPKRRHVLILSAAKCSEIFLRNLYQNGRNFLFLSVPCGTCTVLILQHQICVVIRLISITVIDMKYRST